MKKLLLVASLGLCTTLMQAQTQSVRGVITDLNTGEPIIGANIVVQGHSGVGAVTDLSGKFVLNVPRGAKNLSVSYIGYKSLIVAIKPNLTVKLEPDNSILDDLVVTAVGIARSQKSLGYSTQKVNAKDLTTTRIADVNNALVGKVAGIRFVGGSGATFDGGKIVLRGANSLTPGGREPIYVVDGVITNKMMVNMDDVESINVLKGPAATALYGSEGGDGAIVITSKGGKAGEAHTEVGISHSLLVEQAVSYYKYQREYGGGAAGLQTFHARANDPEEIRKLDGQRYYDYQNDVNWGSKFDGKPYIPWYAWDPTHPGYGTTATWEAASEDNLLHLFRTGITNTTNVSFLRSGKDHTSRLSFSNINRNGIVANSDQTRRYLTFKTNFSPLKNLNVGLDYKYTYSQTHNALSEEYGNSGVVYSYTQWFHTNVDIEGLKDYKRPDGSYRSWNITSPRDLTPLYHNSPFAMLNEINQYTTYQWHVFQGTASYQILPQLKASLLVNGNMRTMLWEKKISKGFISSDLRDSYHSEQNRTIDIRTVGSLGYSDRFFNDKLTLDATAYIEARDQRYDRLWANTADGLAADNLFNLSASVGNVQADNYLERIRQQSVYGNLVLGWDNIYYLDFSGRNDWHSSLPTSANSFFYGGASASVLLSSLLPKSDILNFWKVRASIAQVGSTMSPYRVEQTYMLGKFGTTTTQTERTLLFNKAIRPTISSSYEVGTEFRLLNNRLWGDINYYYRVAKDQIISASVTSFSGYSSRNMNVGKIENKGIEVSLGGSPIKTKNFEWEINANFSKNDNRLKELYGGSEDRYRVAYRGFSNRAYLWAEVGKPLGTIRTAGLKRTAEGDIILRRRNPNSTNYATVAATHGEYDLVRESNEDIDYGTVQPDATGGFSTSIRYKQLSLRASFDWQLGGKIISVTNMFGEASGLLDVTAAMNDRGKNVRDQLAEGGGIHVRGVEEVANASGGSTYRPVDTYISANHYYEVKGQLLGEYVYSASYLKMREIALTYELPKSLVSKLGFIKQAYL